MHKYWPLYLIVFLISCAGNKTNPTEVKEDLGIKAINVIEKEGYKLAVHDFESIKPIFHKTNSDTTFVINFWATWCRPCVAELPYFEMLHDEYKNRKVKVILVSLDFPKKIESALIPFILKEKLQAEVLALIDTDFNSWIDKVDETWSGAIPATLIYKQDSRGFYEQSFESYVDLENVLKRHR